ncbi:ABC transporter substrate-binding protein [Halomarina pelagica]|uniref:ABC transporter substrate-binding protein n=1 Tax=Halomarina pelagica TaxID=2961599 RepID=UPI0020C3922B|nr:ABC transporter substrate-binding protein [Halomarina sp. BND7]
MIPPFDATDSTDTPRADRTSEASRARETPRRPGTPETSDGVRATTRRDVLRVLGAGGSMALAGCAALTPSKGARSDDEKRRTLRMIGTPIQTLDPVASVDTASNRVVTQLYDGLVQYPKGRPDPEPLLATDVRTAEGGRVYTFALKEDVTFSDGSALTAADVVYSFERCAASEHSMWSSTLLDVLGVAHDTRTVDGEGEGGSTGAYAPGSLGVRAVDEHTVEIRLDEPFHAALEVLALPAFGIVPEGIVGDVEGYEGELAYERFARESPVGAGPFAFDRWESGTEYAVVARKGYHGDGPRIAGIHWQVIEDPGAAFDHALQREVDAFWVPNAAFDRGKLAIESTDDAGRAVGTYGPLSNGLTATYLRVPLVATYFVGFDPTAVPRAVRRAVAHLLDGRTIVERVHKGRGEAAVHLTPPSVFPGGPAGYDDHARGYPYGGERGMERARAVLADAGYDESNPASLTFTTYDSGAWHETATLLRSKAASVGLTIEIESAPFPTLVERAMKGSLAAFSFAWTMDYPAPDNFLQLLDPENEQSPFRGWGGTPAAARARSAWETIRAHPRATDEDRRVRARAYRTMEEANWQDVVVLPVYHPIGEGFYYPWVDLPRKTGAAGFDKHKYTDVTLGERSA